MTGLIDSREIYQYYAAMDVLVHPTYREGFGMVIQEAGALAVPVITTDIPGASEVMENGISSIHVRVKDEKALKVAMESFIKHQDKACYRNPIAQTEGLPPKDKSRKNRDDSKEYYQPHRFKVRV